MSYKASIEGCGLTTMCSTASARLNRSRAKYHIYLEFEVHGQRGLNGFDK